MPCPECAVETAHVHGWCERTVSDVPVDGRPVVLDVRVHRLACRDWRCPRRTFREQLPGLLERYQRRTVRLTAQVGAVVRELAGRAGARMPAVLGAPLSRHTALRALLRIPLAAVGQCLPGTHTGRRKDHHPGSVAAGPRSTRCGVGLLECARRLNLALNTVKRYARVDKPEQMRRAPQYRPTLVDPYREYLRKRRAEDPAVPVLQLLREIRERGYTGSQNLLYRYITQGRVEDDRSVPPPPRPAPARPPISSPTSTNFSPITAVRMVTSAACDAVQPHRIGQSAQHLLRPDGYTTRRRRWARWRQVGPQ